MRFPISTTGRTTRATNSSPLSLFDKFFSEFFTDADFGTTADALTPAIDVSETDKELRFDFAMPGVAEDDIAVEIHDGRLVVEAERKREVFAEDEQPKLHASEHYFGKLMRRLVLPKGLDHDAVSATLDKGVLRIVIPKVEPTQPRKIEIRSATN